LSGIFVGAVPGEVVDAVDLVAGEAGEPRLGVEGGVDGGPWRRGASGPGGAPLRPGEPLALPEVSMDFR
jgi:hypothetical protein